MCIRDSPRPDLLLERQSALLSRVADLADDLEAFGLVTQVHRVHLLARVDQFVLRTGDLQDRQRALVESPEEGKDDHDETARLDRVEFRNGGAPGKNQRGLD